MRKYQSQGTASTLLSSAITSYEKGRRCCTSLLICANIKHSSRTLADRPPRPQRRRSMENIAQPRVSNEAYCRIMICMNLSLQKDLVSWIGTTCAPLKAGQSQEHPFHLKQFGFSSTRRKHVLLPDLIVFQILFDVLKQALELTVLTNAVTLYSVKGLAHYAQCQ